MLHGALLVDKPVGISSFAVLAELQKSTGLPRKERPKLGHGGTLDPFATGLLVVCVGEGTKLSQYFLKSQKKYEGEIVFGTSTASGDFTNEVTATSPHLPESVEQIQLAANGFSLEPYLQVPPMYSAIKQQGKPLYELARQGIEVAREARLCEISDFKISDYLPPVAKFSVTCSAGTYIRVLAEDLAKKMGTLAHLKSLRRVASGNFSIQNALPLKILCETPMATWPSLPAWVPFDSMLGAYSARGYTKLQISAEHYTALVYGQKAVLPSILANLPPALSHDAPPSPLLLYFGTHLVGIISHSQLDRVFPLQNRE